MFKQRWKFKTLVEKDIRIIKVDTTREKIISKYIWLILKFIISGMVLYLIYIDILFIVAYDELEKIAKMDKVELINYTPELGLFNLAFFAFGGILEFISLFNNLFLILFPFLIIAINIILQVIILLAILIFKEKAKILIVSILIIFICIMLFVGIF